MCSNLGQRFAVKKPILTVETNIQRYNNFLSFKNTIRNITGIIVNEFVLYPKQTNAEKIRKIIDINLSKTVFKSFHFQSNNIITKIDEIHPTEAS